jgi:glycosyltransferase involved in cell wall biosynthesis
LIANVTHLDLNARGGSERLAIATMEALSQLEDVELELSTFQRPNIIELQSAFGQSSVSVIKKARTMRILNSFDELSDKKEYDLNINTHGDLLPFYQANFSKSNSITYCHFPAAKYLIDTQDAEYIKLMNRLASKKSTSRASTERLLQSADIAYVSMMNNSTILTNSQYSSKAISKTFNLRSVVLSPPVDVDTFRKEVLTPSLPEERNNQVLVISRFNPSNKIENAIRLAKLLKQNGIGKRMKIVRSLSPDRLDYYSSLLTMVRDYKLTDYVKFEVNVTFQELMTNMRESKVYLHPLPGEPFGISAVEAMSSGLLPVVPEIGGHTEFVPLKYQFGTFGQAVKAVSAAFNAPYEESVLISDSVQLFSIKNYTQRFKQIVNELIAPIVKHVLT